MKRYANTNPVRTQASLVTMASTRVRADFGGKAQSATATAIALLGRCVR